jgi:hypothetical protein
LKSFNISAKFQLAAMNFKRKKRRKNLDILLKTETSETGNTFNTAGLYSVT